MISSFATGRGKSTPGILWPKPMGCPVTFATVGADVMSLIRSIDAIGHCKVPCASGAPRHADRLSALDRPAF